MGLRLESKRELDLSNVEESSSVRRVTEKTEGGPTFPHAVSPTMTAFLRMEF